MKNEIHIALMLALSSAMVSCGLKDDKGGQESEYKLLTVEEVQCLDVNKVTLDELGRLGIPVLNITTLNSEIPSYEIAEKPYDYCMGQGLTNVTKVPGQLSIWDKGKMIYYSGDYVKGESGMTIRVRGNTSCTLFEKKPYKIKLQSSEDLLFRDNNGECRDKDWLLIKDDYLYAMLGLKVNEMIGLEWTPSYKYVNVLFNGKYIGFYALIESVEREKTRVNISKTGYLFEYDAYWWNESFYVPSRIARRPMNYTLKYPDPEDMSDDERSKFSSIISIFEDSILDGSYPDIIDVESFVNWILAHDILGGWDGDGSNYYLTKYGDSQSEKIKMSTMWDFDAILSTKDKWDGAHDKFVYKYLFQDSCFVESYVNRYKDIKGWLFPQVVSWLQQLQESEEGYALTLSLLLNHKRWPDYSCEGLSSSLASFIDWMNEREIWLSSQCEAISLN